MAASSQKLVGIQVAQRSPWRRFASQGLANEIIDGINQIDQ